MKKRAAPVFASTMQTPEPCGRRTDSFYQFSKCSSIVRRISRIAIDARSHSFGFSLLPGAKNHILDSSASEPGRMAKPSDRAFETAPFVLFTMTKLYSPLAVELDRLSMRTKTIPRSAKLLSPLRNEIRRPFACPKLMACQPLHSNWCWPPDLKSLRPSKADTDCNPWVELVVGTS